MLFPWSQILSQTPSVFEKEGADFEEDNEELEEKVTESKVGMCFNNPDEEY